MALSAPNPPNSGAWHASRYRIEREIARGGMGVVYRAFDRLAQKPVALKQINSDSGNASEPASSSRNGQPASARLSLSATIPALSTSPAGDGQHRRLALAQEYRILASLRHRNIVSVLDYGFDPQGQSYLVMELLEDARSITDVCQTLPPEQRVKLLAKLMQALRYLHYAGVVHRDVKPDNVLVVARPGQEPIVKVVDFGLAIEAAKPTSQTIAAGTLAYLAPEVLAGAPPSKAADMYALGVLCYQVCCGRHPFALHTEPAPPPSSRHAPDLEALPLNADSRALLDELLAANPAARLQDAGLALRRWCEANGLQVPAEPQGSRSHFMQAARFVGREAELRKLSDAIGAAQRQRGSTWLVTGASGVGKSRLLDEVKTVARVRGLLVLRGRARDGGGRSLALWRGVLRELALHVPLRALEASVLKSVVRDLEELIERPIAPAPQLGRDGNLQRLATVAEQLLARLEKPAVLLLEDLQWADAASATLLKRVFASASGRPLVVIGSARTEARPAWLSELRGACEMRLYPFADDLVKAMCETALGGAETQRKVAAQVSLASQGNPLLVMEMLRSLKEDGGGEDNAETLAQQRAALSPEALLKRRIERVPPWAREGLELAAVSGRQLDLQVLGQLLADVRGWLHACAAAGVIEVSEARWRFSHDQLREALRAQLDPQTRRQRHRDVARALGAALGRGAPAAAMAYHYDAAGDAAAALPYTLQAAEQALQQGALQKAQHLAGRALGYGDHCALSQRDKVRAHHVLLDASFGLGQPQRSVQHTRALFDEVGLRWPARESPEAVLAQLLDTLRTAPLPDLADSTRIDLNRKGASPAGGTSPHNHQAAALTATSEPTTSLWPMAMAAAWTGFRVHLFLDDAPQAFLLLLMIHRLSRALGLAAKMAEVHCGFAYALSMTPLRRVGLQLLASAGRVIERHGDARAKTTLLEGRAMTMINLGRWHQAEQQLAALQRHAAQLGDERKQWLAALQLGLSLQARGQLDAAQREADALNRYEALLTDGQLQAMTRVRRGWLALYRGEIEPARQQFDLTQLDQLLVNLRLALMGGQCVALWHSGRQAEGQELALAMLDLLGGRRTRQLGGHAGLFSVPAMAHVLLCAYRQQPDESRWQDAETALLQLRSYSRQFLSARPSDLRLTARAAQLRGDLRRARKLLQRSITSAQKLQMPLERAMAVLELTALELAALKRSTLKRTSQKRSVRTSQKRSVLRRFARKWTTRPSPAAALLKRAKQAEQTLRDAGAHGCLKLLVNGTRSHSDDSHDSAS